MKLAFSNAVCSDWNLSTLLAKAKEYGYEGLELYGLSNGSQSIPELYANPKAVAQQFSESGVPLVCLTTTAMFSSADTHVVAQNIALVREHIELASVLGCPFVRVLPGELSKSRLIGYERRDLVLARIGQTLRELAPLAAERGVTIVIENAGEYADSSAMWYFVDAAESPVVRSYWNAVAARVCQERPSLSIPRLSSKLGLIRINDGRFNDRGRITEHTLIGQGDAEVRHTIQLLKGLAYRGYLVVGGPNANNSVNTAEVLSAAVQFLREAIAEPPVVLTAYKGDKYKPRQGHEFAKA